MPKKFQGADVPKINVSETSIIIPVKNNQAGLDNFLQVYFCLQFVNGYPKEIIIVDNNSSPRIFISREFLDRTTPVKLITCAKPGPASCRNLGAINASGSWLLFTDSDCIPTVSFLVGYLKNDNGSVAYAGNIKARGSDFLSKFYETQNVLMPDGITFPNYTTTANTLIWKQAFLSIGGFRESFYFAGGEDVDLGMRLRCAGQLSFSLDSLVLHDFNGGIIGFMNRFIRYGRAARILEKEWGVSHRPRLSLLRVKTLTDFLLALLRYFGEVAGYQMENAKSITARYGRICAMK